MDWTREQLWNRMDALDAFDWCEPQQYAALRALFFDGVLWQGDEYPPTWMTCRACRVFCNAAIWDSETPTLRSFTSVCAA